MTISYQPHFQWINNQQEAMVQLLLNWSEINSGSHHLAGLDRMRQALTDGFSSLGGEIEEISLDTLEAVDSKGEIIQVPLGKALRIIKRPQARYRVFLGGHMDTVFGSDHPFQKASWRDANTLNGPGVADMKGGLVVMLKTLEALEQSPYAQSIGWEVLINPDEEIGSPGSAPLLEEATRRNHFGLIYEPAFADGTLAGNRKGSGSFTAVVHGRTAHAGREPHLGHNAIVALAEFIQAINALNGQQSGITVNPGRIEGGGPVNIVPDLAICRFNVRVAAVHEQDWVQQQLRRICDRIQNQEGISIHLHGGFGRPPKILSSKNLELLQHLATCGNELDIPVRWQDSGGVCDGNNLAAAGLPNIDSLGVRGGGLHSSDEFVLVDSLTERACLSALLLMKLGSGELSWPEGSAGVS